MRYARDRNRSIGVTKHALLYVKRNGTRSDRPAHAGETARHENFNFLLMGTVSKICMYMYAVCPFFRGATVVWALSV